MKSLKSIALAVFLLGSVCGFSQRLDPVPPANNTSKPRSNDESNYASFKDRLFWGGGIGFAFAANQLMLDLSPMMGVKLNERFSGGVGVTYKYSRFYDYFPGVDLVSNIWGGSLFLRANIYAGLYARVEYEHLQIIQKFTERNSPQIRDQFNSFFVGGGYATPLAGKSSAFVEILYNLNDTPNSPYTNPVIRVGFIVGM